MKPKFIAPKNMRPPPAKWPRRWLVGLALLVSAAAGAIAAVPVG